MISVRLRAQRSTKPISSSAIAAHRSAIPNDSFEVDAALEELGFEIDTATTWYEITDYLFSKGRYHEAALAQRYAVPTGRSRECL